MDLRTAHDGPAAGRRHIGDEIVFLHEPCLFADLALVLPHGAYDIERLPAEPLPELSRTHGVQRNLAEIFLSRTLTGTSAKARQCEVHRNEEGPPRCDCTTLVMEFDS